MTQADTARHGAREGGGGEEEREEREGEEEERERGREGEGEGGRELSVCPSHVCINTHKNGHYAN